MVLPLIIGGISAIGSAASAVGGYQSQQAQVNAANNNRIADYNERVRLQQWNWRNTLNLWAAKKNDYEATVQNINKGLDQAYLNSSLQIAEEFKAAAFGGEDMLTNRASAKGKIAASGVARGRSTSRVAGSIDAQYGRNVARLAASLDSKKTAARQRNYGLMIQAQSALNQAYSQVAVAPATPPQIAAPQMVPGVSPMGMVGGLINAGMGMANTIAAYDFSPKVGSNRASLGIGGASYDMAREYGGAGYSYPGGLNTTGWNAYSPSASNFMGSGLFGRGGW